MSFFSIFRNKSSTFIAGHSKKATDKKEVKKPAEEKPKHELSLAEMKKQKEKEAAKKPQTIARATKEDTKNAYRILIKPRVTEKGTYLAGENKYLFNVAQFANKVEIKKAIWALYGVKAIGVNIINVLGKNVRYGKSKGVTKNTKKAIITLRKGDAIQVYEGV